MTSGLVSSRIAPNSRMAAMLASSCSGCSSCGRVINCGACAVTNAATISPIVQFLFVLNVADAKFQKLGLEIVHVHPEFLVSESFTRLLLLSDSFRAEPCDFRRVQAGYDDDTVHVGDDHVAGIDDGARALDRDVDMSRGRCDRAVTRAGRRPDRTVH